MKNAVMLFVWLALCLTVHTVRIDAAQCAVTIPIVRSFDEASVCKALPVSPEEATIELARRIQLFVDNAGTWNGIDAAFLKHLPLLIADFKKPLSDEIIEPGTKHYLGLFVRNLKRDAGEAENLGCEDFYTSIDKILVAQEKKHNTEKLSAQMFGEADPNAHVSSSRERADAVLIGQKPQTFMQRWWKLFTAGACVLAITGLALAFILTRSHRPALSA